MKYMFASDIHGSAYYVKEVLSKFTQHQADRLILLGDLLYHGPRNDLPRDYNPREVLSLLNQHKTHIYAVRGNCDSEVDQMVLEFPMMADYALLSLNSLTIYATHGHLYHQQHLPPMVNGDILIHGHTHLPVADKKGDIFLLNPGSAALPKENNPCSYGMLEDNKFIIYDFNDVVIKQITF